VLQLVKKWKNEGGPILARRMTDPQKGQSAGPCRSVPPGSKKACGKMLAS
jgi:hypothetical protein